MKLLGCLYDLQFKVSFLEYVVCYARSKYKQSQTTHNEEYRTVNMTCVCVCVATESVGVTTGQDCGGGCLNQGLCGYGDVCHCARGWHGRRCELAQCTPPGCVNGGVCVAPDTCRCPPGYSGTRCQDGE